MKAELEAEGHQVNFVMINITNAESTQGKLVDKCNFPLFKDVAAVGAWKLHDGGKDDMYVYDTQGKLVTYLPFGGPVNTFLSTSEGYGNLKDAVLAALDG